MKSSAIFSTIFIHFASCKFFYDEDNHLYNMKNQHIPTDRIFILKIFMCKEVPSKEGDLCTEMPYSSSLCLHSFLSHLSPGTALLYTYVSDIFNNLSMKDRLLQNIESYLVRSSSAVRSNLAGCRQM